MSNLEIKAKKAFDLKIKFSRMYSEDDPEASKVEMEYLTLRKEVLQEIGEDMHRQKSEPIRVVRERVERKIAPKRISTGIRALDYELVTEEMKSRGDIGGFSIGNFIQIAGAKGTGKSSLMMKLLTGFSNYEKVGWFDFEMGEDRVVSKLRAFKHNEDNLLYYSASRSLSDVTDEIKFLNILGVKHFVIDSAMKITVKDSDRYDKFSNISSEISSLTSSLGINIYMINQMSQSAEREGHLAIKHGNDAEYDADYIFYLVNAIKYKKDIDGNVLKGKGGKPVPDFDKEGTMQKDSNKRILKCDKNRQDERLFSVEILKHDIFSEPVEVIYEENTN